MARSKLEGDLDRRRFDPIIDGVLNRRAEYSSYNVSRAFFPLGSQGLRLLGVLLGGSALLCMLKVFPLI